MPYLVSYCVPILGVHHSKTNPPMAQYRPRPFIVLPTNTRKPNFREGTLVERSRSDALRARCVFCNIPYFRVPTWEAAHATFQSAQSGAHMRNRRSLVSSDGV